MELRQPSISSLADETFSALLVHCAGRTFVAGADISIFDEPDFTTVVLNTALAGMEQSTRPAVAVLHGTALGGGLEVALACHYRIALPGARVGLPEVKLGILPGSLGTQRFPRLTGPAFALEATQSGRMISVTEALAAGIVDVDVAVDGDPLQAGPAYAAYLLAQDTPPRRSSEQSASIKPVAEDFFAQACRRPRRLAPHTRRRARLSKSSSRPPHGRSKKARPSSTSC